MRATVAAPRRHLRLARALDVVLAFALGVAALPLALVVAMLVRAGGRPVLFVQTRLGRDGAPFRLHKFRTLAVVDEDRVPAVARPGDPRLTPLGRRLRRWRLDELPQLWDVLRGRMALVGPRPEVPDNLAAVPDEARRRLFAVRPGLTGPTQLRFLAEDDVLAEFSDPVRVYRDVLVPAKVKDDLAWLEGRTLRGDLRTLLATPFAVVSPGARARSRAFVRALVDDVSRRGPRAPSPRDRPR